MSFSARIPVGVMIVFLGACGGGADGSGIVDPPPAAVTISMPGNSFSPFNAMIRVGDKVNWEFPSEEHDVVFVAVAGAPANIPVTTRAIVTRTFNTAGVYPYDCRVHPGMSGQVSVSQ